jgi:hypothetical protein
VTAFVDKFSVAGKDTGLEKMLKDRGIKTFIPVGVGALSTDLQILHLCVMLIVLACTVSFGALLTLGISNSLGGLP